ncbi:hypothetical protein VTO42DRAFT_8745 [Malbranchea cinnamomea]
MAAADVRDMLDLPAESGQKPRPTKKQKAVVKRPAGAGRELFALLGENAPPIALNENKYKEKFPRNIRVRSWEMAPFTNPARSDGLVLHHWRRKPGPNDLPPPDGDEDEDAKKNGKHEYPFAKYNVKVQCPKRYTDEQYDKLLQSDDWSREETDYLMDLAGEYDLRWVVIADRYDYRPKAASASGESTALVPTGRHRTMEDMKSRYYTVAAHMLAIETPPSEMTEAELKIYETMQNFDPEREKQRKNLATALLNRTKEECHEEALLLEELKRIVANERDFMEERRELYARLEAPLSTGNTTMYQSSQGLSQLLQQLVQADKNKKRRPLLGPETGASSPASQAGAQATPTGARDSRPETPAATTSASNTKKGSSASAAAAQPQVKTLTPAEEAKYGVTHHDRLTSGVQFRNDRAQKLTQAKSNIQSQKLAAALTELGIPPRLFMPTEKVCKEFEKLVHLVNMLLDTRKVSEKLEGEIRVLEAAKQERERREREKAEAEASSAEAKGVQVNAAPAADSGGDTHAGDARKAPENQGEQPTTAEEAGPTNGPGPSPTKESHKRSASVLSTASDKSTKKQKR